MVAVTGKTSLGPFVHSRAQTVHNFAFVVPVYDYTDVETFAPACDDNCVGYQVFSWDEETSSFTTDGQLYDDINEARADAEGLHDDQRGVYDVATEGTTYFVDYSADLDGKAETTYDLKVSENPKGSFVENGESLIR